MSISEKLISFLKPERKQEKRIPGYDPEKSEPVIRCSICTGEQTAGYKDKADGTFHEVMLIRDENDLREFQQMVHTENIRKEY